MEREDRVASLLILSEDCIFEILSLTSPRDACISAAISRKFKSTADSDALWERFLPSDYREMLARSDSPVVYSTKKQLYFLLSDSSILIDGGKLSFMVDKWSGKKCYMVPSRELNIAWKDDERYWNWPSLPESRFTEVAKLRYVCWLDIRCKIETRMLSPATTYAAYIVYKVSRDSRDHIGLVNTSVRFVRDEVEPETFSVYLNEAVNTMNASLWERWVPRSSVLRQPQKRTDGWMEIEWVPRSSVLRQPQNRTDGWMEIELGEFFVDRGDEGEVEMRLMETEDLNTKRGLIVEGIEVRPI